MWQFQHLFQPIQIGKMTVKNRIVMAPMGTNLATHEGEITARMRAYYEARAHGGVGLIITEDTTIGPKYIKNTVSLAEDRFIPAWRGFAAALHAHGAKVAPQLIHPAFNAPPGLNNAQQPVAASPIPSRSLRAIPRELTAAEIEEIIKQFGDAARRAQEAGCDAVQIHCAHVHHLLGGFISPAHNKRTDEYGAGLEGRLKLPLAVIQEIRARTSGDFPILIRISGDEHLPGVRNLEETCWVAPHLVEAGVNALHVSAGSSGTPFTTPPTGSPQAPNAPLAARIKQAVNAPIICVGRITQPWAAENVISRGDADMVALGRALLADPEWPNKVEGGLIEDIAPCLGESACLSLAVSKGELGCLINASAGREQEMALSPTTLPKKVLVVGGGPAGLEAARVAAQRGHNVTLMEKSPKLGGQLLLAAFPPMKQEFTLAVKYLARQADKAGVQVQLNREVTPELVGEMQPDVVILASGGEPLIPESISGIEGEGVVSAWDVLAGKVFPGPNILIIGGNKVGCETADYLAHPVDDMHPLGNRVTILEMMDNLILDDMTAWRSLLVQRLKAKGVRIVTGARVTRVLPDGVTYEIDGKERTIRGMNAIVLAVGTAAYNPLQKALQERGIPIHVIGDAKQPRNALEAIAEGAAIARHI